MTRLLSVLLAAALAVPAGAQTKAVAPVEAPVRVMAPVSGAAGTAPSLSAPQATPVLPLPSAPSPLLSPAAVPSAALTPKAASAAQAPHASALPAAAVPAPVRPAAPQAVADPSEAPAIPGETAATGAAQAVGRAAPERGVDGSLRALGRLFDGARDEASEGNSVVPTAERRRTAEGVRRRFHGQLDAMLRREPEDLPLIEQVRTEGDALLSEIDRLMARGEIDPRAELRAGPDDPEVKAQRRELRIGVYPVAADPFQWAHLLIGLRAMAAFRLDKVVFVLAGDDPRKPTMTPVDFRHPMGRAVLDTFAPFFQYSSIAVGTTFDGETNIFRMLALNRKQKMKAFYLVGGDHYRLKDKNGNDDTLPKIEKRLKDPEAGHVPARHSIEAAFIAREGMDEHVPTSLEVHFLPNMSFEASSTLVRGGKHALMPYAAYEYVEKNRPGLYGVGTKGDPAPAK